MTDAAEVFEQHRGALTGVAYRMLGSVADAEDVVQEAWLRWSKADRDAVRRPRAYLVRTTTRLAIDRLRHEKARRESYVGHWLPEPLPDDLTAAGDATGPASDPAERTVFAETVGLALLNVMESLSPLERAVFVLREAFALPYAEIAEILGRGEPAVRQLGSRARNSIAANRPRFEADPARQRDLTESFLAACTTGDLSGLLGILAPQARMVSDGGGVVKAPLRTIEGADKVARFLLGIARQGVPDPGFALVEVNGGIGLLATSRGLPHTLFWLDVADGRVQGVYMLANPGKLSGLMSHSGGAHPSERA